MDRSDEGNKKGDSDTDDRQLAAGNIRRRREIARSIEDISRPWAYYMRHDMTVT